MEKCALYGAHKQVHFLWASRKTNNNVYDIVEDIAYFPLFSLIAMDCWEIVSLFVFFCLALYLQMMVHILRSIY